MINWEEIAQTDNTDKLKDAKLWLFRENIRLETEKKEFYETRDRFLNERLVYQRELDSLNRRTVQERQRLREENLFFEKKMAILQEGFRQLGEDRRAFEQKLKQEEAGRRLQGRKSSSASEDIAKRLFKGINNVLVLRKRYKDLTKIYHPDNLFGDEELMQLINREYLRRKEEL